MWVTKQLYKQRNKYDGDNWLLEKLFVLFIQDWKLHAIVDNNLFWKVENQRGKIQWKTAESIDSDSENGKQTYKQRKNVE